MKKLLCLLCVLCLLTALVSRLLETEVQTGHHGAGSVRSLRG